VRGGGTGEGGIRARKISGQTKCGASSSSSECNLLSVADNRGIGRGRRRWTRVRPGPGRIRGSGTSPVETRRGGTLLSLSLSLSLFLLRRGAVVEETISIIPVVALMFYEDTYAFLWSVQSQFVWETELFSRRPTRSVSPRPPFAPDPPRRAFLSVS